MTQIIQATLNVNGKLSTTQDLGSLAATIAKSYGVNLADGAAAGQSNRCFADTRQLAASANEDLDLAGSLLGPDGSAFSVARIKGMIIAAAAGNTNNVVVGGAAATQFASWVGAAAHTVIVRPGAVLALIAGQADSTCYTVGAGASDLLRIANSGGGTVVNYDIILWGAAS